MGKSEQKEHIQTIATGISLLRDCYLNERLVVLLLHLTGSDPVEALVVVDTGGGVVDGQGAQRHVHAVQPNVDGEVRVDFLVGEGSVRRGDLGLRRVPRRSMLTDLKIRNLYSLL